MFFGLLASYSGYAQPFGNEWIKFSQQYFKVPVAKDGIYHLSYTDLQSAGFDVNADPLRIQVWHRGKQVSRNIVAGQYIEFYGKKNDGVSDVELYKPGTQPHQYYNLYNDTTAYFLSINRGEGDNGVAMESFTENGTGITAETYHHDEKLRVFGSQYASGVWYNNGWVQNTIFETGEGWTGDYINKDGYIDYTLDNITNTVPAGGNPQIEIQVVGRAGSTKNLITHQVEIYVGSGLRFLTSKTFATNSSATLSASLNWSDISADGKLTVRVKAVGVSGANDRLSASYIKVNFPQALHANSSEKVFTLETNANNKSFIQIQNAPVGAKVFDITNPDTVRIIGTSSTSTLNAVVDKTNVERKLLVTNSYLSAPIRKVSFRPVEAGVHNYIIISHPLLMTPANGYANPVKSYASYRASVSGGEYDTLVMNIYDLYNQFNYGEISPLAIRHFMAYLCQNPLAMPNYLFLIGKGLDVYYGYYRNPTVFTDLKDLIPPAGFPASDIVYTVGLAGTVYEPAVPTGRLSASSPQEVAAYLNKVKEMEALPFNALWRKELLHLSGGINVGEPEVFKSLLEQFGTHATTYYLGGKISAIAKNDRDIKFVNVSDKINDGVSLVTVFGHSSPESGDFNIGFATAPELGYNNSGKYPVFLVNGCNAGDFFTTTTRYGEDWINASNKGSIGFIAHTSYGFVDALNAYSNLFYSSAFTDSTILGKGVGDVQKETAKNLAKISDIPRYVAQAQQMLLLGDPAVKIFGAKKPDYEINSNGVYEESLNGDPITAMSDSFAIKIIVQNFGRAIEDSLSVSITQTLSDNSTVRYDTLFPAVLNIDTLTVKILKNEKGFGRSVFEVEVDTDHIIHELEETNNKATYDFDIPLRSSRNLFPQDFSIVNTGTVNLTVQSTNVLDAARDYIIQIDTTLRFDSPLFDEFIINGKIVSKNIPLYTGADTLVYYWRSRYASKVDNFESDQWSTNSFTYIKNGPEGWAQVDFPQYQSNQLTDLLVDEHSMRFSFNQTITDVSITTFGLNSAGYTQNMYGTIYNPGTSVKVGGAEYHPISLINAGIITPCRKNTINLVAFDKVTTVPYVSMFSIQNSIYTCGKRPEIISSYSASEVENGPYDLINNINNIQLGDSVILFSVGNPGYSSWSVNVINKVAELGISQTQLNSLVEGEPVVIYAKKGAAPGSAVIYKSLVAPLTEQSLQVDGTVTGRSTSGNMKSTWIGPATHWQTLYQKTSITELPQTDAFTFDVIGRTSAGIETQIKTALTGIEVDLTDIDPTQYPFIRLIYHATDEVNLTPPQLNKWIVAYTPAAEGVIVFDGDTDQQTIQEGENWSESLSFRNISQKEFSDSLVVQYTFNNSTYRTSFPYSKKIKAPLPGEQIDFSLDTNTQGKGGLNNLKVFVNPKILPETYYDNNVVELRSYLNVIEDRYKPVLNVTFDNRHLLEGDYVSPNPAIEVELWDDNKILFVTDTSRVSMYMKSICDACEFDAVVYKKVSYSNSDVAWWPADAQSPYRIRFTPHNLLPGKYALQVQAEDAKGNSAAITDEVGNPIHYEITFRVAENDRIYIQHPYPNPSSNVFFFPVVVTGDNVPDQMRMQIVSTNGRFISEVSISNLITGNNSIPWAPTDGAGNPLPDGLYFYRIVLIKDGSQIKTSTGKLMFIRK